MIQFLCGCTSNMQIPIPAFMDYIENLGMSLEEAKQAYFKANDQVQLDAQGFIVCYVHRARRQGWRSPLHGRNHALTDRELERLTVWGEEPKRPKTEIQPSTVPDLRPHIYEGMLDEIALSAIARADRPVGSGANGSADHWTPTISHEQVAHALSDNGEAYHDGD